MSPEMWLAQSLGELPTTEIEKTAHSFDSLSIEELEDMLRKEAMAAPMVSKPPTLHPRSTALRPSFVTHTNHPPAVPAQTPPTGTMHTAEADLINLSIDELEGILKTAAKKENSLIKMADAWGRQLARSNFEKTAIPTQLMKGVGGAMRWATTTPTARRAIQGAAAGGLAGVGQYAMSNDPNKSFVGSVGTGAAIGAAGGAGASHAAQAVGASQNMAGAVARRGMAGSIKATGGAAASSVNQTAQKSLGEMRAARIAGRPVDANSKAKAWQAARTKAFDARQAAKATAGNVPAAPGVVAPAAAKSPPAPTAPTTTGVQAKQVAAKQKAQQAVAKAPAAPVKTPPPATVPSTPPPPAGPAPDPQIATATQRAQHAVEKGSQQAKALAKGVTQPPGPIQLNKPVPPIRLNKPVMLN